MNLFTAYHAAYDNIPEHISIKEIILEKYGHVQSKLHCVPDSNVVKGDNDHLEGWLMFMMHLLEVNLIYNDQVCLS